uniref:Uncharacterized protein n=1 Tax=Globodera rostochiensis TaxID=31243 RepID=A0A914I0Z1_GLORO
MNVQRFFAYGQFFTVNESVAAIFSNIANTVLRYEIRLQRHIGGVYTATVSMPIFCITVLAFVAMTESNARRSLLWLVIKIKIVCLILMLLQNDRMMQALPADFDSEPFCVNLSRFLLLQLVLMLIFRVWYAVESDRMEQQKSCDGNPSGDSNGILPQFVKRIRPSSVSGLYKPFKSASKTIPQGKMHFKFSLIVLLLSALALFFADAFRQQSLWNKNRIGRDDQLADVKTDSLGNFALDGGVGALFGMNVHMKIYHDCDRGMLPCQRKADFGIPSDYITRSSAVQKCALGDWYVEKTSLYVFKCN